MKASPKGVVRSADLSRRDRELLQRAGYLKNIVKGWYFLVRSGLPAGESTAWYASYWNFLEAYLSERFGDDCANATSRRLSECVGKRFDARRNCAFCTVHPGGDGRGLEPTISPPQRNTLKCLTPTYI
jgi:hypothetical protein